MIDLIIKANRPELKPNSLKIYLSALKKLNDNQPITSINFLKDFDSIMNKLDGKSQNTKKSYLNAVVVALQALKEDKELIEKYVKMRDGFQNEYIELVKSHKKSEKQETNWIEWKDYLAMIEKLKDNVKHLNRKKDWTTEDIGNYQEYLITTLYKHYPVRNDFHDMKVISKRDYNKLSKEDKKKSNFLVRSNPMLLILNEYKTSKRYGEKKIEIVPEVAKVISTYLKHHNTGYLLNQPNDFLKPMTTNGVTRSLQKISMREFDGKKIGSSMLRHMYLSHKYGDDVSNKAEDSYVMGHSLQQQDDYIKV